MLNGLEVGTVNCVIDCAEVRKNQRVYVVNEQGAVDPQVAEAITEVAAAEGAAVRNVWAEAIPKAQPGNIPEAVLQAYKDGDVVVSHYPSLQREALHVHFPGETRVRVPNRADRNHLLQSEWARFPYSVQKALSNALDSLMLPGAMWHLTGPNGTDLKGVFVGRDSTVSQAYFALGDENTRARRNFPGGVHSPHNSTDVEGIVVVDYLDHHPEVGRSEPLSIEIRDNRVVGVTGGEQVESIRKDLAEKTDGFLDSWHAGVNPRTVAAVSRDANARKWFGYAHCSPRMLHLHLGRSHAPVNVAVFNQSISVNGQPIYEQGELLELEDPTVQAAMRKAGLSFQSLRSDTEIL